MRSIRFVQVGLVAAFGMLVVGPVGTASSAPFKQGPKVCQECHEAEYEVWEETKHAKSFKTVHKSDKAEEVLDALGAKSMKREATCSLCHYTVVQKDAGDKGKPRAGPSCESCHGASSDFIDIHNDYGGKDVKREDESAEHKAERRKNAAAAGMIWPSELFDVASNCATCHGLAHPDLDGATLSTMLGAGHPLNPNFEMVAYSQGSVRHRFYPPDVTNNKEMSAAELARMFAVGQAAKLVSAAGALSKSDDAKYQEVQQKRMSDAKAALGAIPEAAALVGDPTEANGRAFAAAIADKDLSGAVGGMLPNPSSYK